MRTLSKKEVIIVQRINQQRDLLMNQEFKLPNVRFVLNRYAYNPSIFFDAQQYVRELIGKIKLKIQK